MAESRSPSRPRPYFDLGLLATTFFPDVGAAHGLRTEIRQQDEALGRLDKDIAQLEAHLCELRTQRATLAECQYTNKAFLAPIRRIPTETLGQILAHVPHTLKGYQVPGVTVLPLIFMQVCRRWLKMVPEAPLLWTTLDFDKWGYPREANCVKFVDMWLSNSGALPIDIDMAKTVPAASRIIVRNLHRFRSIKASLGPTFLDELASQDLPISAPSLQCIQILDSFGELPLGQGLRHCIHAPRLSNITVPGSALMDLFDFHPPTVHHLSIPLQEGPSPSPLDHLRTFSNLSYINLVITEETAPSTTEVHSPLLLPSLSTLRITISGEGDDIASSLLESIRAPALHKLYFKVETHGHGEQAFDSLILCLGEKPPLQQLSMVNFYLPPSKAISFICKLSSLRSVRLHYCVIEEEILQVLTPEPSSPSSSWVCPELSALRWIKCITHGGALIMFMHRRTPVVGSDGGLSRVDLLGCYNETGRVLDVRALLPNSELMRINWRRAYPHLGEELDVHERLGFSDDEEE